MMRRHRSVGRPESGRNLAGPPAKQDRDKNRDRDVRVEHVVRMQSTSTIRRTSLFILVIDTISIC